MKIFGVFIFIILFLVQNPGQNYAQEVVPKIHPALQDVLLNTSKGEKFDVYAILKDRYPLEDLKQQTLFLSKKEKRTEIVKTLKEFASEKQERVLNFLRDAQLQNKVTRLDVLWTVNTVVFTAEADVIYSLANNFDEIKEIRYDRKFNTKLTHNEIITASKDVKLGMDEVTINPGITLIKADLVWDEGYYGQGVFVASIDEGCSWAHPDLINNIWVNPGEDIDGDGVVGDYGEPASGGDEDGLDNDGNGKIDDLIGWDFENNDNNVDGSWHGSRSAGIVVGDGTLGIKTGIAPMAKLVNLQIGDNDHTLQSYCWLAMQYAITLGVDIITHSQSFHLNYEPPPDIAMFRDLVVLELQAGIIHFTSISNDGDIVGQLPPPYNISTPGNCPPPWLHPEQTLVGGLSSIMGVGDVDVETDIIEYDSPYGPSAWEDYSGSPFDIIVPERFWDYPYLTDPGSIGLLTPDVSAPGENTITTDGGNGGTNWGYTDGSGTSASTPHAAGTAALLLSVNPNLTPAEICEIMETSAVDKGDPGYDNRYGAGRIDAYAAYLLTISAFPVELTSFTAKLNGKSVELRWRTETEVNNYGFDIERTKENSDWLTIGFVEGYGNSNSPKTYNFIDSDINQSGIYYYRLQQVDNDGTYEYSDVVSVEVGLPDNFYLSQNYPNPFNPETRIDFTLPEKQLVSLRVYNTLGELVGELVNEEKEAGSYSLTFDASSADGGLASGVYIYRLQTSSYAANNKMTLLK